MKYGKYENERKRSTVSCHHHSPVLVSFRVLVVLHSCPTLGARSCFATSVCVGENKESCVSELENERRLFVTPDAEHEQQQIYC